MKRCIHFGSTEKFVSVIRDIKHKTSYLGLDKDGNVQYKSSYEMPIVTAIGTEKIHGTNAGVSYSRPDGLWAQSKSNIITPESDNMGCAKAVHENLEAWENTIGVLAAEYNINLSDSIITVYFEWSGGNIQKKSALTGLDKRAMIFQYFKVSPIEPIINKEGQEEKAYWLPTSYENDMMGNGPNDTEWVDYQSANIFNIMSFPYVEVQVDFSRPDLAQNEMIKLMEENEMNSPVGQKFGIQDNILEGHYYTFMLDGRLYRWKVKGEKHTSTKVKTLKPVDSVKEQAKIDFATYACSAGRLEQMYKEIQDTKDEGQVVTMRDFGIFLGKVNQDIHKEEQDELEKAGLSMKEVGGKVKEIIMPWYNEQLMNEASA